MKLPPPPVRYLCGYTLLQLSSLPKHQITYIYKHPDVSLHTFIDIYKHLSTTIHVFMHISIWLPILLYTYIRHNIIYACTFFYVLLCTVTDKTAFLPRFLVIAPCKLIIGVLCKHLSHRDFLLFLAKYRLTPTEHVFLGSIKIGFCQCPYLLPVWT